MDVLDQINKASERVGYVYALTDINRWIIRACAQPGMDMHTLEALNEEMKRLNFRSQDTLETVKP